MFRVAILVNVKHPVNSKKRRFIELLNQGYFQFRKNGTKPFLLAQ